MHRLSVLFSFFLLVIFPASVNAQVVINEVFPNPPNNPPGSSQEPDEFIELYISGSEPVDISGWILDDMEGGTSPYIIPDNTIIEQGKFLFFKKEVTGIALNNGEDEARLLRSDGSTLVDVYSYDIDSKDEGISYGRVPDGTGSWVKLDSPSPGDENSAAPTPTNSPTPTNKPTSTPKPTKTPTPALTNTPTPPSASKPTIKTVKTPTGKQSLVDEDKEKESLTLGLRDELTITPTPDDSTESSASGKIPIFALLFILGGIGFIGTAAYPFFKKKRYNQNSDPNKNKN